MLKTPTYFRRFVVSAVVLTALAGLANAQDARLDDLFDSLRQSGPEAAREIEGRIWQEWSRSGSPSFDLLLERGRAALRNGEKDLAIEHFTALIDHAPDFAEGYNARATAFFQSGLLGPALEDLRAALALNPRHFGALAGLALVFEEIGMYDGALAAWREVERIHPQQEGLREAIARLEPRIDGAAL